MRSDESLLGASLADPDQFEPLVERHAQAVFGYLARRAPEAADDLLSEVWVAAFASRATFDGNQGTVRGWLFGIARNRLLAHYRTRTDDPIDERHDLAADDSWAAVDNRLDAAAIAKQMRAAVADLPADERELITLIAWEQLTPSEAAQVLGIPAGTARSRLHRARGRLQARLSPVVHTPQSPLFLKGAVT